MKKLVFTMVVVVAGVASAVSFSYQGALRTAEGEPIPVTERNKTITFRLYDTPTGTDALWGRMIAVHLDDNGLFNVELSNDTGSDVGGVKTNDLAWVLSQYPGKEHDLYIGLDVSGSSGEIRPRQKLLNVPSAAFAADVSQAKGDFSVSGNATIEGMVTAKNGLTVENGRANLKGGLTVSNGSLSIGTGITITPGGDTSRGIIPQGVIVMWSGAADKIPQGWALCDGQTYGGVKTPDLRNRFIVGAGGKYGPNATGGEENVTLNADQLPPHQHQIQVRWRYYQLADQDGENNRAVADIWPEKRWDHIPGFWDWYLFTLSSGGNGQPHNNMPPYYALCFIMKL